MSPHANNNVGCEGCHGGDPSTADSFLAHVGVLNSRNPASKVHRSNIVRTCGTCHPGPFAAFQGSRHFALLEEGDEQAPVCTACHSEVAARLLSPRRLEVRCQRCHAEGRVGGNPQFPSQARSMLEAIREVRDLLDEARPLIRRVSDRDRREQLEEQYQQAEVPVIEAVQLGHSFNFERVEERRSTARGRAEALLQRLANPTE